MVEDHGRRRQCHAGTQSEADSGQQQEKTDRKAYQRKDEKSHDEPAGRQRLAESHQGFAIQLPAMDVTEPCCHGRYGEEQGDFSAVPP